MEKSQPYPNAGALQLRSYLPDHDQLVGPALLSELQPHSCPSDAQIYKRLSGTHVDADVDDPPLLRTWRRGHGTNAQATAC